ncbi:MAG: 16S rRNA (guanine(966)-N(2))-methyltransferase RsmD [Bacillales bacterium]|jgi:16S rRNA (guanine(966)-N(2))-methyltransferase RsmD|nr:16S rRNA (guanine(966)-N(2))-methyltransferase RsmD [Bacillales bacterium]
MRIISGIFKHRLIKTVGNEIRPTSDLVRQSLLNILQSVENYHVLDLFAGAGGIGIECISRGAKEVTFNDINGSSLKVIKENLESLGILNYSFSKKDALLYLKETLEKYDLIYVDPPYAYLDYLKIHEEILKREILNEKGIIVYEMDYKNTQLETLALKTYKYGKTKLVIFKKD